MPILSTIKTFCVSVMLVLCAAILNSQAEAAPAGMSARLSASEVKTTLELARAARTAGDISTAIRLYRGVAGQKADPALQVEFGDALLQGGLIDEAIGVYQAVPVRSRAELGALLGLQQCYARLSQPQRALEYAQRAAALAPRDERAQVSLGVALDTAGRHAEAQAAYRQALAAAPRSVAARNDLALSLALTGQFQEAIDLLTPIARSANASPRARQNLAFIYGLKGDQAQAWALGRADLEPSVAEANLRFFEYFRTRAK